MPDGQVLEFSHVTKRFGSVAAVSDFSARIEPGVVTGFLGPNGAGKTTSLRMLLGLIRPTSGTATIGGRRYSELAHPMREVGAALEASSFHPGRSGANHLKVYARAAGVPVSRVDEVLELVGLSDAAGRKAGGYSLGMRQRLGLATALLGDPGVLVLDEPANGLDPEGIRWMRGFLRQLAAEGRTVLVSSHVLGEVQQTAQSLLIIAQGQRVFQGALWELSADDEQAVVVDSPDRAALVEALRESGLSYEVLRAGLTIRGADTTEVGTIVAGAGVALSTLHKRGPALEEVFLELVNGLRVHPSAQGIAGSLEAGEVPDAGAAADAEDAPEDEATGVEETAAAAVAAEAAATGGAFAAGEALAAAETAAAEEIAVDEDETDADATAAPSVTETVIADAEGGPAAAAPLDDAAQVDATPVSAAAAARGIDETGELPPIDPEVPLPVEPTGHFTLEVDPAQSADSGDQVADVTEQASDPVEPHDDGDEETDEVAASEPDAASGVYSPSAEAEPAHTEEPEVQDPWVAEDHPEDTDAHADSGSEADLDSEAHADSGVAASDVVDDTPFVVGSDGSVEQAHEEPSADDEHGEGAHDAEAPEHPDEEPEHGEHREAPADEAHADEEGEQR